jgi:hypothetical protein
MFYPRRLFLGSVLMATASASAPVSAAPAPASTPAPTTLKYDFAEDTLESRWSWRGDAVLPVGSEIAVALGWKDAANSSYLSVKNDGKSLNVTLQSVKNGVAIPIAMGKVVLKSSSAASGELGLQKVGNRVRVLWNGQVVATGQMMLIGDQFGTALRGEAKLVAEEPQPTETKVFGDDFMRAESPDDAEIPSEWQVTGVWKTSGSLGPKSDATLNPNPFVFRAQGTSSTARAGAWWWSDYSVSTSLRAMRVDDKAPLVAGIEAFSDGKNGGLSAQIDFNQGVAILKDGARVLARSAPFDTQPNQWHRVRLDPGPGTARFYVDGVLRVSAPAQRAQGSVLLRATTSGNNFVDFDNVRLGALKNGHEWGEGASLDPALPDRFQKDRLMRNWANAASAWKRDTKGVWWNTGDFFGAAKLQLALPNLKAGDGFQLIFAADPKNDQSGVRYEISRPTDKPELVGRLKSGEMAKVAPQVFPMTPGEMPISLSFSPKNSVSASLIGSLNGQKIEKSSIIPVPRFIRGTKVGILPLENGSPAPSSFQSIKIASATYQRNENTVIGINFTPITPGIARQIGLPDGLGAAVDNVDDESPAKKAGVLEGDVIRAVEGTPVTSAASMKEVVGAVKPGTVINLDILRPQSKVSGLDLERAFASAPSVLDYSFTAAPVDWQAARGNWEIAERWTCSPQWSFFSGQNDASPLLWSRFATQGDWTLEAYLASPMDLVRGERSPTDLNITVGGDGVDLASGYSFIFGGAERTVNQIRRGDAVAWEKPFEMPPGVGDTHQDWFYMRIERRQTPQGVRFRYSVNGRELANYLDPKPLSDGGHIGFWTQNGGLSIARVRLWNAGVRAPESGKSLPVLAQTPQTLTNVLDKWSSRGQGSESSARLILASETKGMQKPARPALQIVNPRSGGDWTTFVTRKPFNPTLQPNLEWDYKIGSGVKVNLYALVDDIWREIVFTGDATSSDASDMAQLGRVTIAPGSDGWHHASFDLAAALRAKGIQGTVDALAFAAPDRDYLRSGIGGNHQGATYWLRNFRAKK